MLVSLSNKPGAKIPPRQSARVQREIFLRLAGALHPVNVIAALCSRNAFTSSRSSASRRLHSTSSCPDVLVLAQFDEVADGLAQALNRQRDVV